MKLLMGALLTISIWTNKAHAKCESVINDLVAYSTEARKHESNIADFVKTESGEIGRWHNGLKNWEGQTVTVNPGTFNFVKTESDILSTVSGQIRSNSQYFRKHFDQLIQN